MMRSGPYRFLRFGRLAGVAAAQLTTNAYRHEITRVVVVAVSCECRRAALHSAWRPTPRRTATSRRSRRCCCFCCRCYCFRCRCCCFRFRRFAAPWKWRFHRRRWCSSKPSPSPWPLQLLRSDCRWWYYCCWTSALLPRLYANPGCAPANSIAAVTASVATTCTASGTCGEWDPSKSGWLFFSYIRKRVYIFHYPREIFLLFLFFFTILYIFLPLSIYYTSRCNTFSPYTADGRHYS